ncbi:hypothetical protein VaNZ11_004053 [Volvox africanus]|uniref:Uncharacterized protein n=1 Tax=Volvox africanus TaxID=51714 RepID=A0ABQ5RWP4_9CHLO|nr:hypothetical protein VaNZ11_004053 [Volvox africanus]
MTLGHGALLVLLLGALFFFSQATASSEGHGNGLREAAAKRGTDLARAPDGSIATDAPLPVLHAHIGVRGAADLSHESLSTFGESRKSDAGSAARDAVANPSVSLWLLLAMTMVMALLTGVGALPYLFTGKLNPYWSGIANAVGCGVMLAASFDLLEESKAYSASLVLGGILLGVLAMAYSQSWLSKFEDVTFSDLQGADARKAMLIIGVMAAHAFGEGSGVGVSFSGPRGWAQGLLVTIAIGLHNIPEGMAVATIMVARGTPPRTALYWTLLSALPQGIVAVPSYLFVETFTGLLPIALGFAAGCMIWIVFAELIPDALESAEHGHVATAATLSAAALQCISMVIAKLERADGSVASPIAADVSVLVPDLLLLLPGFVLPCAAAGLAGTLLPSLPLSMGVSVGASTWAGLAGLATALLSHHQHHTHGLGLDHHYLRKHAAVLWAAAGAATCAALWCASTTLLRALPGAHHGDGESKDAEGGSVSLGIELGIPLDAGIGARTVLPAAHHRNEKQLQQLQMQFPPGALAVAIGGQVQDTSDDTQHWGPTGGPYQNGHSGAAITTVHATGVAAGPRIMGAAGLERRNGFGGGGPLHSASDDGSGMASWLTSQSRELHCQGNCSCKDCDVKLADTWGTPMDLLPAANRPGECVRAAIVVGAMLLMGMVPAAYEVAEVLIRNLGNASTLLPPLVLRGIAPGVACVGIVRAVAGNPGWRLPAAAAGLLGATLLGGVSLLLLPLPCGRVAAEDIVFDPTRLADRLRAFTSGGLLLASVGYLWPAAVHFKPRKVQLGVSIGMGLGVLLALLQIGLCAGTPYCLAPRTGTVWTAAR